MEPKTKQERCALEDETRPTDQRLNSEALQTSDLLYALSRFRGITWNQITISQMIAFLHLSLQDGQTAREMSKTSPLSLSTVFTAMDRLSRFGLVEMRMLQEKEQQGRSGSQAFFLTDKGRQLHSELVS